MRPRRQLRAQAVDDPAIRGAVERFYAAQEAEDAGAYLALWSRTAERPSADRLKYIFESGDDRFSDLTILRATPTRDGALVRVSVTRDRTGIASGRPDGSPLSSHSVMTWSLQYAHEDGDWKLVREGSLVDGLALLLIEAQTAEQREQLMAAEPQLVGSGLMRSVSRQGDAFAQKNQYAVAHGIYARALEIADRR